MREFLYIERKENSFNYLILESYLKERISLIKSECGKIKIFKVREDVYLV